MKINRTLAAAITLVLTIVISIAYFLAVALDKTTYNSGPANYMLHLAFHVIAVTALMLVTLYGSWWLMEKKLKIISR